MMYIHYCRYCRRIHILNGHKAYCPACSGKLTELDISYLKYVNLSRQDRRALKEKMRRRKSAAGAFRKIPLQKRRRMVPAAGAGRRNRPRYR